MQSWIVLLLQIVNFQQIWNFLKSNWNATYADDDEKCSTLMIESTAYHVRVHCVLVSVCVCGSRFEGNNMPDCTNIECVYSGAGQKNSQKGIWFLEFLGTYLEFWRISTHLECFSHDLMAENSSMPMGDPQKRGHCHFSMGHFEWVKTEKILQVNSGRVRIRDRAIVPRLKIPKMTPEISCTHVIYFAPYKLAHLSVQWNCVLPWHMGKMVVVAA